MLVIAATLCNLIGMLAWPYIWFGPGDILRVGRSKNGYKKLKKSMSWSGRLLRRNYVQLSKTAVKLQRFFVIMTYVFYVLVLLLIILLIVSAFYPKASALLPYYFLIKGCLIEIPAFFVVYLNRRRIKGRGLWTTWAFTKESGHRK